VPHVFCIQTLDAIILRYNLSFHFYADGAPLYLSFDPFMAQAAVAKLVYCISDIRDWMAANFLKLNDDEKELVIIGHPKRLEKVCDVELSVGINKIRP